MSPFYGKSGVGRWIKPLSFWAILGPLPHFHRAEPRLGILFLGIAIVLGHSVEGDDRRDVLAFRMRISWHQKNGKSSQMSSKCHPNVIQMSSKCHPNVSHILPYNYMLFRWSFVLKQLDYTSWRLMEDTEVWCIWDLPEWTIIHHTHPCRDTGIVCLNAVWHGISSIWVFWHTISLIAGRMCCVLPGYDIMWYNVYFHNYTHV